MELTWPNKLRIAGVIVLGVVVIGIAAWPLAAPRDPLMPVRAWGISPFGTMTLLVLAFAVGFGGYFIAWPHGREIGILGVPFGLAVWAGRSGPMRVLTQAFDETYERSALLLSLRFEPIYWLAVVAAGFVGVLVAQQLRPGSSPALTVAQIKGYLKPDRYLNSALALVIATVVTTLCIGIFARDMTSSYNGVRSQPQVGQIIFGSIAAFGVAAFVVKKFLDLSYLWPAVASIFILPFAGAVYYRAEDVQKFAEVRPATFFPQTVFAILPVALVGLGALGAVIGYWLAVRYDYWRSHESAG